MLLALIYLIVFGHKGNKIKKENKILNVDFSSELNCQEVNYSYLHTASLWRHDIHQNGTQHNGIQHNNTQHNDVQYDGKQNAALSLMTLSIMAEHCHAECHR